MPYSTQLMHIGAREREQSMPPMSTTPQPNASQICVTIFFASASLPQRNISGGPPGNCGLIMCALPTVLNALTTRARGIRRWICSPRESVVPTNSVGGIPLLKSSGFVASIRTLLSKDSSPASLIASAAPAPRVARTRMSPNCAASANVPAETRAFADAHSRSFSGSREPIFTSWPRLAKPAASSLPTSPEPSTPTRTFCMREVYRDVESPDAQNTLHRRRPADRHDGRLAGAAAATTPLHAEPRHPVDGQERRPVHRLLPVHVRQLDGQQSDPARSVALERLRQDHERERAVPVGHPRGRGETEREPHRRAGADRRLLRRVHE